MALDKQKMDAYSRILHTELKVAMGCTEPIAVAYCAAYAARLLGREPERVEAACSSNIIKNVKAVVVPQTGGRTGIETAVLAGAIGGDPDAELEVLAGLTDEHRARIAQALKKGIVRVSALESAHPLHIVIDAFAGEDRATVELADSHTGIIRAVKNGVPYPIRASSREDEEACADWKKLNVADILAYADEADLSTVSEVLERQVAFNIAIAREGLEKTYGCGVGPTLFVRSENSLRERAKALASAASDARMNGCPLPVVINSGSGNQGITVSVPIAVYAEAMNAGKEKLERALLVGNLIAIHQKTGIGKLSAFCGATCAAAGAVCGIAYMKGEGYEVISRLLTNCLATIGGMICDGAKSSCASKIAVALESAFTGYDLARREMSFMTGEGIVGRNVEETIGNIARVAAVGMRGTDKEILSIMLSDGENKTSA